MRFFYLLLLVLIVSCKPATKKLTAQQIIDKSFENTGVGKLKKSEIQFMFRNTLYFAKRNGGDFFLGKKKDSIVDVLSNDGFKRLINEKGVILPEILSNKYANAINSVHYFSVLPYGLNDKAVQKQLMPSVDIKGEEYYKIKVTFKKDGGGEDYQDVFIYWISKKDFNLDYLAYSYNTNGGGIRFRANKKEQIINGVRFVDYDNYKPKIVSTSLESIDEAFTKNELIKVSEIVLKNIEVTLN